MPKEQMKIGVILDGGGGPWSWRRDRTDPKARVDIKNYIGEATPANGGIAQAQPTALFSGAAQAGSKTFWI